MKILITTPDFSAHGGIRVIMEWANRLTKWHDVTLYPLKRVQNHLFSVSKKLKVDYDPQIKDFDCVIITSPHSIHLEKQIQPGQKCFLFLQMMEHLFRPNDTEWFELCYQMYSSKHPMFCISSWVIDALHAQFTRKSYTHLVGNGVNLDEFPISHTAKNKKVVLVEGWDAANPTKDVHNKAAKVAIELKHNHGVQIKAYGRQRPRFMPNEIDEYVALPSLADMNRLYEEATILIKASKVDCRSCSPMEAMTKGTVTARAINMGDDDLNAGQNCMRSLYNENLLYGHAEALLLSDHFRNNLADTCRKYVQTYNWDYWMQNINSIIMASA